MEDIILISSEKNIESIVGLAIKGDKDAFITLINENRINLYRVAKGMLQSEADIEDAIQNTIIKAYESIEKLRNEEFFKTWLIRILINQCNMTIRANKKLVTIENINVDNKYYDNYEDLDLSKAIASLNEDLREVTVLYYYEDMAQSDIAKAMKIPQGTVKSKLYRAKEKLFELLKCEDN